MRGTLWAVGDDAGVGAGESGGHVENIWELDGMW
jgi:hypothetical protein